MMRNGYTVLAAVAMLAFLCAPPASATAELRLTDGTNYVDITDNNGVAPVCVGAVTGCTDANGSVNVVTFVGTLGTWTLNVSTGSSHGALAGTDIDLNSVNSTSAASTLTILFSDDGFASGPRSFSVGGTNQGLTLAFSAYEAASKFLGCAALPVPGACTGQIGVTLNFNTSGAFSGSTGGAGVGTALTERAVLTSTGAGSVSFDAAVTPVPEPVSVALLGGMLLCTVRAIRRRARRA